MTRIKICGITNEEDARHAEAARADALGFVFAESPRQIPFARAAEIIGTLGPFTTPVGVFVNPSLEDLAQARECGIRAAQIHAPAEAYPGPTAAHMPIIWAVRVRDAASLEAISRLVPPPTAVLLDAYREGVEGGTGRTFDWTLAASAGRWEIPIILAGGLADDNVGEAIRQAAPWGVDASSRLESAPGKKDRALVERFIRAVRMADRAADGLTG